MRLQLTFIAAATILSGCGVLSDSPDLENPGGLVGPGSAPTTTSSGAYCLFTGDVCQEVAATLDATQKGDIQSSCTTAGGSYATGSCPSSGAVPGSCSMPSPSFGWTSVTGGTFTKVYYTAGPWDATTAAADCSTGGGTWTP